MSKPPNSAKSERTAIARMRGLKPWRKGQSGNPAGRPAAARGLREALTARYGTDGHQLIARLEELARSEDERVALHAVELLLAYLAGKPQQHVELAGGVDFLGLVLAAARMIEGTDHE
jgi:hypothetical protein